MSKITHSCIIGNDFSVVPYAFFKETRKNNKIAVRYININVNAIYCDGLSVLALPDL